MMDESAVQTWINEMDFLSQKLCQSGKDIKRLKPLLTTLYPDSSIRCHKGLLNRFRFNGRFLRNMLHGSQFTVKTILQHLKIARVRRGCNEGRRS